MDWRYGAHYFEERLIDHDVTSNYGGWNAASGLGPGKVLQFNALRQSKKFDPEGEYIKTWCPELKSVPLFFLHDPWNMSMTQQKTAGVLIGQHYPEVIKCKKYLEPQFNTQSALFGSSTPQQEQKRGGNRPRSR